MTSPLRTFRRSGECERTLLRGGGWIAATAILYWGAMISGLSFAPATDARGLTGSTAGGSLSVDLNEDRRADVIFCYRRIQPLGDATGGERVLEVMPLDGTALLFSGGDGLLLRDGDLIAPAHLPAEEWQQSAIVLMRRAAGASRWQRTLISDDRTILPVAVTLAGRRHYSWLRVDLDEQSGILTLLDSATHPLPGQAFTAGASPASTIDSTQLTLAEGVK